MDLLTKMIDMENSGGTQDPSAFRQALAVHDPSVYAAGEEPFGSPCRCTTHVPERASRLLSCVCRAGEYGDSRELLVQLIGWLSELGGCASLFRISRTSEHYCTMCGVHGAGAAAQPGEELHLSVPLQELRGHDNSLAAALNVSPKECCRLRFDDCFSNSNNSHTLRYPSFPMQAYSNRCQRPQCEGILKPNISESLPRLLVITLEGADVRQPTGALEAILLKITEVWFSSTPSYDVVKAPFLQCMAHQSHA